jgi:hypothetical protein
MELREKIGRAILDAMDVQDGLDAEAAAKYADAILSIPEIAEALELSSRCYLHDGPGGVSVQLR